MSLRWVFCTVTLVKIRVLVAMRYENSTFNPLNLSEFASELQTAEGLRLTCSKPLHSDRLQLIEQNNFVEKVVSVFLSCSNNNLKLFDPTLHT